MLEGVLPISVVYDVTVTEYQPCIHEWKPLGACH